MRLVVVLELIVWMSDAVRLRNTGVNAAHPESAQLNIPDAAGDPSANLVVLIGFQVLSTTP